MKTAKYLLCENQIADKSDGRVFILHNRDPRILAEVFHFDMADADSPQVLALKSQSPIGASLNYNHEYILFTANWVNQTDKLASLPAQKQADKLAGIMRRMADWYEAYLNWEDEQA